MYFFFLMENGTKWCCYSHKVIRRQSWNVTFKKKKGYASVKKVYLLCFSLSEHFVFAEKLHPHCLFWAVNESLLRSLTATSARWLNSETAACLMQHVKSTREWFEIWSVLITCQEVGKKRRVAEKVVHTTSAAAAACCLNTHPPSPSWTN